MQKIQLLSLSRSHPLRGDTKCLVKQQRFQVFETFCPGAWCVHIESLSSLLLGQLDCGQALFWPRHATPENQEREEPFDCVRLFWF